MNHRDEVKENIRNLSRDEELKKKSLDWILDSTKHNYCYNFSWLGRPVIQYPQDILAMQEMIWKTKPDLIIETGIAHGGSLIFSASMLLLLDVCESIAEGKEFHIHESSRKVLGIDIDIRAHNREAIERHPLIPYVEMIEGSSIDPDIINQVKPVVSNHERVLVCLDSNHTHEHVMAELEAFSPFVSENSYCIVFDTIIEDLPEGFLPNRSWGKGNNAKTAVWEFLKSHPEFEIDRDMHNKLMITVAPDGFLRRKTK